MSNGGTFRSRIKSLDKTALGILKATVNEERSFCRRCFGDELVSTEATQDGERAVVGHEATLKRDHKSKAEEPEMMLKAA